MKFSADKTPDRDSASGSVDTVGSTKKLKGSKSTRKGHWLSAIGELHYLRLSRQFADRYTGTQQRQVQTMLDTAYVEFNRQSDLPVSDVSAIVCDVLRSTQLPVGLDKPEAGEWINRMLARSGDKHPYCFVRRFMTEPGYLLPNGQRDEPELDLSPR